MYGKNKLMTILTIACVLAMVGSASATTISLNGTAFAADTYEGDTVGNTVVADTGTWAGPFGGGAAELAVVTNAGSPGAFSGSQYAIMDNPSDTTSQPGIEATGGSASAGDTLQYRSMMYLDSGMSNITSPFGILFRLGGSNTVYTYRNANGTWKDFIGAANVAGPSGLLFDTWQEWTLDYTVGAATATLTVAGTTMTITGASGNTGTFSAHIFANKNNIPNDDVYLDDVPEPATMIMLVLGGLAGLLRRRR